MALPSLLALFFFILPYFLHINPPSSCQSHFSMGPAFPTQLFSMVVNIIYGTTSIFPCGCTITMGVDLPTTLHFLYIIQFSSWNSTPPISRYHSCANQLLYGTPPRPLDGTIPLRPSYTIGPHPSIRIYHLRRALAFLWDATFFTRLWRLHVTPPPRADLPSPEVFAFTDGLHL